MPHREEKKRDSDDEEDNNPLPELAESLTATRVSTLLERRRTSTTLASINLQAASSAVGVSELSPATAGTTPTSASNRRASLVPATPTRKDALPSPVRSTTVDLAARRSSVALNQIGGEDQRRGSALFASTTSGKDPPSPFRVTFGTATRLDSPSSSRFPPPLGPPPSSSRDPLLNMNQNDLRRPSFAQTIAATGESILKGQSPRRKLRKAATRLLLLGLLLFALAKALAFLFPSYDILHSSPLRPSRQVDPYTHDQLPPAFTEFANRPPPIAEPSPSLKPAKEDGRGSQEPVLSGEELRRFREDHLWGPPSDKVETEVVKPEEGQSHEATVVFIHVSSRAPVMRTGES